MSLAQLPGTNCIIGLMDDIAARRTSRNIERPSGIM
jgi:hypothetical protein